MTIYNSDCEKIVTLKNFRINESKGKYFEGTICQATGMNVYDEIGSCEIVKPRHDV